LLVENNLILFILQAMNKLNCICLIDVDHA
jgi:hypothetical protein